jgi:hypothetical protein
VQAIWSFWTKPNRYREVWPSQRHHLLAWALSLGTVRRHYQHTTLWTDTEGAKLLVDDIGLEFEHVSTSLDALKECDPGWWVLGKLHAYRLQTEPFVHFDNDVFLWRRFPERIEAAQVLAQNPEDFVLGTSFYDPEKFDQALNECGGWMPDEWEWYASIGRWRRAVCCGVFGGNNLDFIRHYANTAFALAEHPQNQSAWASLPDKTDDNILFEQYLLSACINYHRHKSDSPFHGIDIRYLFSSWAEAFRAEVAAELGYTHLIGGAKRNSRLAARLAKRVESEYPEFYERIVRKTSSA